LTSPKEFLRNKRNSLFIFSDVTTKSGGPVFTIYDDGDFTDPAEIKILSNDCCAVKNAKIKIGYW